MTPLKIAVDNQISWDTVRMLEHKGFLVVFKACHEPDEVWFKQAVELGAQVFISPDHDIKHLCIKNKKIWLKLDQNLPAHKAYGFICEAVWKLQRVAS